MTDVRSFRSPWLGELEWSAAAELFFPAGLPGFETELRLLPVEIPAQRPLIYLQSLENPDVCFIALPVRAIHPGFDLQLPEEDARLLGLSPGIVPRMGVDVLCLALLVPADGTVVANLDAPVVVNLHRGIGAQSLPADGMSPRRFVLTDQGWERTC